MRGLLTVAVFLALALTGVASAQSETRTVLAFIDARHASATDAVPAQAATEDDQVQDFAVFRECDHCPQMVALPAGQFLMGSPTDEAGRQNDEGPQRSVTLHRFAIGRFEITGGDWYACMEAKACRSALQMRQAGPPESYPVINVTWNDAHDYVRWLSSVTGKRYRLLTEAEWEYAARAGTQTVYWWGGTIDLGNVAFASMRPSGSLPANPFGIFEILGNVFEWTEDCYRPNYDGAPADGGAVEGAPCRYRMVRSGWWGSDPVHLRVAQRGSFEPNTRQANLGFRVARDLD